MAPTSTQQSPLHTAVLAALQEHGTGRWPAGVAAAIAEQVGSTPRSVSTTKCLLAKGHSADPAEPPVPEGEQQLGLGLPTANGNGVHQGGAPEADAERAAAGLPPLVVPTWEHDTLADAQRAARGSKRKTKAAASTVSNDNGEQAAPAAAVAQVSAEEPAQPIPADAADPVAEALAELQHNDAIGLQLVVDGKAPSSAACRAAGLPGTWRLTRWPLIRELDPEQLLANQQEQASTDAALEQGMADGVAQAQAERAERTQLCERHRQILLASAITEERISLWETVADPRDLPPALQSWGKKAVPCMATTWLTVSGALVPQIRVDTPIPLKNGRPARYLFPKDSGGIVGTDAAFERDWGNAHVPMLMVEGTKQFQAAASTINPEVPFAIPFGLAGCWGWSSDLKPSADLLALPVEGRDVLVAFDADVASNWMVWEAARRLEKYLLGELMARSVRFLINPGTGGASDGLDDLLGRQPTLERRVKLLRHLIDTAIEHKVIKAPKRPAKLTAFFDGANFKPASCLDYLSGENHLAMSGDQSVAVYQGGVFHNGTSLWWTRLVSETLGDDYRPEFEASVTKIALAQLKTEGLVIPFQQPRPVINFQNCLLDVRELLQRDHTPEHLTLIQLPHRWNPGAECPVFLRWVEQVAPGQLDGLLDVCCQMLDLSEWPRLIVFLTGPTRSGKSTWIRILNALVGAHLRANVSLHDLSRSGQDKFATSSLFGKVLNTFADLSAEDLQDLSMVKVLTGGDEFEAQRKHGHRFQMRNQAMLVFSANTVPATSESSGAFLARVAHFEFPHSFQGREDKTIEERILRDEIPGVLRLMVEALHKRKQRGNFLPLDEGRQQAFAERTDRVRMFLAERTAPGNKGPRCIPRSELYQLFCSWVEEEHGGKAGRILGKHKFNERVRLAGVEEFKPKNGGWCWDLIEVDPETADPAPPKTADPGGGVDKSGFDFDNGHPSALSEPKLPTKTADPKTAVVVGDLPAAEPGPSALSAVSPYCTTPIQNTQLKLKPAQWVESAETADGLTEAAAVDPALWSPPADPLTVPGSTAPLVVDLETCSADQLWQAPDPAHPFIRLVGTDHGNNTNPADLQGYAGPIVAHNGYGFDFLALARHHGMPLLELSERGLLVDTMVLETLAHPNRDDLKPEQYIRQLGLDAAAERRGLPGKTDDLAKLARTAAKAAGITGSPKQLEVAGYGLIPQGDPAYNAYLSGDVAACRAVFDSQCPGGQLTPYQAREMRLMGRLAHGITGVGFRIDRPEVERREAAKQQRVADTVARLEAIGLPPRIQDKKGKRNTPHATAAGKEAIAAAFAELGITLPTTATGQPQIKADSLLAIAAEHPDTPAAVALAENVAGLVGARSSMGNLLGHATSDRIHPLVFPGQATGRCSITKPGLTVFGKHGANAAEREVFLPDADDHLLLAIDLSKADARAVAVWSQDPGYLDIFCDPARDINKELAAQFGIPKTMAKALGHGTRYNQQARGMHNQTGIALVECERFLEGHRRRHAPVHRWIERVVRIGESGRPLHNGFGRLLHTGRHTAGDRKGESKAFTQAPAYLGQSTTREWMAEGILRLPLEMAMQIRAFLHDEIVLSVPAKHLDLYREALLDAFQFSWAPPESAMVIPVNGAIRPVPVVAELSPPGRTWADCYRGEG